MSGLLTVQGDTEYMLVRRRGRFAMERHQAANPRYRAEAVKMAMAKFIVTMNLKGLQFVDDGWVVVKGNLPHVDYDESSALDLGPLAQPHPLDLAANKEFERAEKTRMAFDMPDPENADLIDFRIVATFKKKRKKVFLPKIRG